MISIPRTCTLLPGQNTTHRVPLWLSLLVMLHV